MEVRADVPVTPASDGSSSSSSTATSPSASWSRSSSQGQQQQAQQQQQVTESKDWVVERRYSEFNRFHAAVKRRLPQLAVLPFPAKVTHA